MAHANLPNLFAETPAELPEELIETILCAEASRLRIERIVSLGHASPPGSWFDQEAGEWVVLLSGAARLRFEAEDAIELLPGDYVNIPAHKRHRVEWTDPARPTVWLAIHYGTRG